MVADRVAPRYFVNIFYPTVTRVRHMIDEFRRYKCLVQPESTIVTARVPSELALHAVHQPKRVSPAGLFNGVEPRCGALVEYCCFFVNPRLGRSWCRPPRARRDECIASRYGHRVRAPRHYRIPPPPKVAGGGSDGAEDGMQVAPRLANRPVAASVIDLRQAIHSRTLGKAATAIADHPPGAG